MEDPRTVVVVGGGPAGRALALQLDAHGLPAVVVDPAPDRTWPATYGAWADELPGWLPPEVVGASMPRATARGMDGHVHPLRRDYAVLDTPALQRALTDAPTRVRRGAAVGRRREGGRVGVVLSDGTVEWGGLVVDATGPARPLSGGTPRRPLAAQTAHGVVVDAATAPATSFMDWRQDHGEGGWPTFLYAVPLSAGRVLLEETSLARRPGLPLDVLRRRLAARLANRGIPVGPDADTEDVAFPVDLPRTPGTGGVVPFGAAAPLVHPATGYSLATSLRLSTSIAGALAAMPARSTTQQRADAVRAVVWSPGARAVHLLRRRGLEVLLRLPPAGVGEFFDTFFALADHHQRAYLSERDRPAPVAAAMAALFRASSTPMRRHLLRHSLGGTMLADA